MLFSPTFLLFSSIFLSPFLRLHFPMQIMNVVDSQSVKYWRAICEPLSFWMKRMLIISYLRFSYFHLVSLDFIHFVCHISLQTPIFLGVEDLTYLTFVNSRNLHFRAKTWFFIIFERSAFIWINLPSSAGIGCHQNSRPAQVHRRWSSWWVPF